MTLEKLLKLKNDPNCKGVHYKIPWGVFAKGDKKKLSDLLCSPGYSKMDFNTHKLVKRLIAKGEKLKEALHE